MRDLYDVFSQEFAADPNLLVSQEVAGSMSTGLSDLERSITAVIEGIHNPVSISDADLDRAGLVGLQLRLKLDAYRSSRAEYQEARELIPAQGFDSTPQQHGFLRKVRRFFRRANPILGSIASIFPPAEAFKEYKETAEASVEDAIEDLEDAQR